MAKRVEELKIWQRAKDLEVAVNAIIDSVNFQRDWKLRDQIRGRNGLGSFKHLGGLRTTH